MYIIEERSKENPKLQPITTDYGELHFSQASKIFVSALPMLPEVEKTRG